MPIFIDEEDADEFRRWKRKRQESLAQAQPVDPAWRAATQPMRAPASVYDEFPGAAAPTSMDAGWQGATQPTPFAYSGPRDAYQPSIAPTRPMQDTASFAPPAPPPPEPMPEPQSMRPMVRDRLSRESILSPFQQAAAMARPGGETAKANLAQQPNSAWQQALQSPELPGLPVVTFGEANEALRRNVPGYAGTADWLGPALEWEQQNIGRPALEVIARGGERMGAAARGEDWQALPSAWDTPEGKGLAQSWEERPLNPAIRLGMEMLAPTPSAIAPIGEAIQGIKAGVKLAAPIARRINEVAAPKLAQGARAANELVTRPDVQAAARRMGPGATVEDVSQAGKISGIGGDAMSLKPWEMTPEQLRNLDFSVPEGGSSKTPKTVFGWSHDNGDYETLYDLASYGDEWRLGEALGKGWERDWRPSLHLKPAVKADRPITVYRTSDVGDILPGSYVTESKEYALKHAEANIKGGDVKLYELQVKPSELMTYGDPHEFIYVPESPEIALERLRQGAKARGELVEEAKPPPAQPKAATKRYYHGTSSTFDAPDVAKFDPDGLYGPGYYLTDSPEVAGSYATKGQTIGAQQALQSKADAIRAKGGPDAEYLARTIEGQIKPSAPQVRAVNVPENLKLLDVEMPAPPNLLHAIIEEFSDPGDSSALIRFRDELPDNPTGHDIWQALHHITADRETPNIILQRNSYDGIRYQGGKRMPLPDAAGNPIEHDAIVVFSESLPKITNALSGKPMGSPPEVGASVLGGVIGSTQGETPEERARNAILGATTGGLGMAGARRGRMGLSVEDVTKAATAGAKDLEDSLTRVAASGELLLKATPEATLGRSLGPDISNSERAPALIAGVPPRPPSEPPIKLGDTTILPPPEGRPPIDRASLDTVSSIGAEKLTGDLLEETLPLGISKSEMEQGGLGRQSGGPPEPPIKVDNTTIVPPPDGPPPIEVNPSRGRPVFSQFWNRARNVIESQGAAGKQLGRMLQETRDRAETMAGHWVLEMPTVRRLDKKEFENFVDVAEAAATPTNDRVAQAAKEWNAVREKVYVKAKLAGLDTGFVEDYFPHRYDPAMFKDRDKWTEAVDHLVKTGQAKDQTEAAMMLRYRNDVLRNRRAGNLEIPRITDLPSYEKTKDALLSYVESAANRIAQVSVLGDKDVKALSLINTIGNQGYDASAVKNLFDISTGAKKYGEYAEIISRGARAFSTFTKLGLGALTNASQSVNTATVTGGMRTLLGTPKALFSKEAKDFALEAGVTLDGVIRNLREGGGWADKIGAIGAPGFSQVEKFNRTLAAYAGRDYARKMATQAAKGDKSGLSALQTMGLDASAIASRGGKLTAQEEIKAARNIVERTQFKVDPQDLPGWASSPLGKVVAQFRTFSYNQTAFIGREIIKPALGGNAKPLIRFLVYGLPVGVAEVELQNYLRNRPSEEDPIQAIRQYYQRIGGIGVLGDVLAGLAPPNSKYLPGERYALQAAGLALGPTVSTALEGIGSIPSALQGKPENIERFLMKQVPVVGPTAKNTFLPYKPGGRGGDVKSAIEKYQKRSELPRNVEKYLNRAVLPPNVEKFLNGQ